MTDIRGYLDKLPLAQALWWFIENGPEEETAELFFYLRERYRREIQS